jgi:nucleoside 2-deoxyribosyltransferase
MLTEEIFTSGGPTKVADALGAPLCTDRVYFGGGLFTDEQKAFHLEITRELETLGFSVFLPQRDGYEAATLVDWSDEQKAQHIYRRDLVEVCRARFIFADLDGAVPDDGLCTELGIAGLHKLINSDKRVIGYRSDTRTFMGTLALNPLVAGPLDLLCSTREEAVRYFAAHAPTGSGAT